MERFIPKKENPVISEKDPHKKISQQTELWLRDVCEINDDPQERIIQVLTRVQAFIDNMGQDIISTDTAQKIYDELQTCDHIQNSEEFIHAIIKILAPLLDLRILYAAKFEKAQAQSMNETEGFTEINRLLSYDKSGSTIHIHAPVGYTVENKLSLYRTGFHELAKIIDADPEIKDITATSPIVAKHHTLFTLMGFHISDVPTALRAAHFTDEKRPIKMACISKKDFLERFLITKEEI